MKPIRILHVFHSMSPGGAETLIINVYRRLDRGRVQFDFAVHTDRTCHYDAEIEALGGRLFRLPNVSRNPGLSGFRAYARALSGVLRENGPLAGVHSHVHYFSGVVLRVASSAGVPLRLAHSHTTHDGEANGLSRRAYRWAMRRLLQRHATHRLGCSRAACQGLFGRDPRACLMPNAIDLSAYAEHDGDRRARRERLGLPLDARLIGHVGRFAPVKNQRFLIDVLAWLPDAHLILIGDGPERSGIERLLREKGLGERVHLLGIRDDVPMLLGALDAFVFPSLYEGLGLALIEAQAAGVPCVASSALPAESDLKLGLVQSVHLSVGARRWAEHVRSAQDAPRPAWSDRRRALEAAGYDVQVLAQQMQALYGGDAILDS